MVKDKFMDTTQTNDKPKVWDNIPELKEGDICIGVNPCAFLVAYPYHYIIKEKIDDISYLVNEVGDNTKRCNFKEYHPSNDDYLLKIIRWDKKNMNYHRIWQRDESNMNLEAYDPNLGR